MVRAATCPICGRKLPPTDNLQSGVRPFCSDRCRQVDLMRWIDGRYAIVEKLDPLLAAELAEGEAAGASAHPVPLDE